MRSSNKSEEVWGNVCPCLAEVYMGIGASGNSTFVYVIYTVRILRSSLTLFASCNLKASTILFPYLHFIPQSSPYKSQIYSGKKISGWPQIQPNSNLSSICTGNVFNNIFATADYHELSTCMLRLFIWKTHHFSYLSVEKLRNCSHLYEMNSRINLQSSPRVMLTVLPSVVT